MAESNEALPQKSLSRDFSVLHQKLSLKIDIRHKTIIGNTCITVTPQSSSLKRLRLHARQCTVKRVVVNEKSAEYTHRDPYCHAELFATNTVFQHHLARQRLEPYMAGIADDNDLLVVTIPTDIKIQSLTSTPQAGSIATLGKASERPVSDTLPVLEAPPVAGLSDGGLNFAPLQLCVDFELKNPRDGLQFVGLDQGDSRYPHLFTQQLNRSRPSACLFPCVDDLQIRCPWEISITCAQTLGDLEKEIAFDGYDTGMRVSASSRSREAALQNQGDRRSVNRSNRHETDASEGSTQLTVICSGELVEEADAPHNDALKTCRFSVTTPISASQVGFAIGPFEDVDLSDMREVDDDEKLGNNAIRVHGYCLPGRSAEVRNTCLPLAKAIDFFTTAITPYPFDGYRVCFVDDLSADAYPSAGLSLCSSRLLLPQNIIDRTYDVTRTLVHALAFQYAGISTVPNEPTDTWVVVGIAFFMTDLFLRQLCGNNEYRWRQKIAADQVVKSDISRPSLYSLGGMLHLDSSETAFLALKSSIVLFILDRRIMKSSGSAGLTRIISRLATNAKMGDMEQSALTTLKFQRLCEKMGHIKLDSFFQQWVFGAGCPYFSVSQKFNKKKLVIEMMITQTQSDRRAEGLDVMQDLDSSIFMRNIKEDYNGVYAEPLQVAFQGPMTIRIHEADGTPYEHIVEIKDTVTKVEIPYNTKYKRLRRNRRHRDKAASMGAVDGSGGDGNDDVLLYCLGDVLQSEDEYKEWRLIDWTDRDEKLMSEESYEWIRMDADFEWICKMQINMSAWMFVSQLQQDRDVVAQFESLQYIISRQENQLVSTFLVRTLMDSRYFYGVRNTAASGLSKCATDSLDMIGLFHLRKAFETLFCMPGSGIPRSNDFSDQQSYLVQIAVLSAISKVKDNSGSAPSQVKKLLLDKLKFNDNSTNEYSDVFHIAMLLGCLAETMIDTQRDSKGPILARQLSVADIEFMKHAINELERYRRIDEWILSYHNVFSQSALISLMRLAKAGVAEFDPRDFLQYTRAGNADMLRVTALECLVRLELQNYAGVLRYVIYTACTDASPFIRRHFTHLLGEMLATIAIGNRHGAGEKAIQDSGLVVVADDTNIEGRKAELERTQTLSGALAFLKQLLHDDMRLQNVLWKACTSSVTAPQDAYDFIEICAMLYEPQDSFRVILKYPRYWRALHLGGGMVSFSRTSHIRTQPLVNHRMPLQPGVFASARVGKDQQLHRRQSYTVKLLTQPSTHSSALPSAQLDHTQSPRNSQEQQLMAPSIKRTKLLKLNVGSRLGSLPAVQKSNSFVSAGTYVSSPQSTPGSRKVGDSPARSTKSHTAQKRKSSTPDRQVTPTAKKLKSTSMPMNQLGVQLTAVSTEDDRGATASIGGRPTLKLKLNVPSQPVTQQDPLD